MNKIKIRRLNEKINSEENIQRSEKFPKVQKLDNNEKMFAGGYNNPLIIEENIKESNSHNMPV